MLLTASNAATKLCPFSSIQSECCLLHKCMAWTTVYPEVTRENHSDGVAMLTEQLMRRVDEHGVHQYIIREGPEGCYQILKLEEVGYCGRLHG